MREIKRMDHNQLNQFLTDLYTDGKEEMKEIAWAAFGDAVKMKGIGPKREYDLVLKFREGMGE